MRDILADYHERDSQVSISSSSEIIMGDSQIKDSLAANHVGFSGPMIMVMMIWHGRYYGRDTLAAFPISLAYCNGR